MKGLILAALLASSAQAITTNPASAVTADSDATPLTIPYRDASGNFAVNALTAASVTNTGAETAASMSVSTLTVDTNTLKTVEGKVGIGTASPCSTCTLHVAGGASVTGNMSVGTVTNDTKFDVKGAAVTPNSGLDAAQAIMSVYGAGQLGIGSDGAGPFGMWMQTFDHGGTSPAAYPILLNPSLGSVGVGTNAPASKFHVSSGTIRIDGTGAPTTGGALCLNAGGAMAKCTSAVDASGNCTCP